MKQSKLESWVEIFFNYASGFVIAWAVYEYIVLPWIWLRGSAFWVTAVFTVVSVIRSYCWRRFFNAGLHRVVHEFIRRFY